MAYIEGMDKLKQYILTHRASAFAKRAGVTVQAVHLWKHGLAQPSPLRAADIERATDGEVKRSDLWPELWPPENQ